MTFDDRPDSPSQPGQNAYDDDATTIFNPQSAPKKGPYQQGNPPSTPGSMPGNTNPNYRPGNPPSLPGSMPNGGPQYPPGNPASMPGPMPGSNPNYQYRQGPPPMPGSNPNYQYWQGPPPMPGSNPNYQYRQGPSSTPGLVADHQNGQNPPSTPEALSGSNPNHQARQNPPSMPGQMLESTANAQTAQAAAPPQPQTTDDKKSGMSRRNILKVSAIVGGVVVVAGGAAVGQQIVAHNHPSAAVQNTPGSSATTTQGPSGGQVREYWVQADAFQHNLVPTGKDGMMGMAFKAQESSYWAVGYRAYTPDWGKPLPGDDNLGSNTGIPGPVFRGSVGDTIRVYFRNNDTHYRLPHSMHPHGVLYTPANDGAWIASDPQPGAKVPFGQTYTYEWKVRPNSVGTWIYHDHSVSPVIGGNMLMEFGAELGLFGFLVLTDSSTKPVTKEFFTFLHDLYQADIPTLSQDYDCFNGFAYLGNTPTFNARVGDSIRWHIGALGKEFHAFHLHGHRWSSNGQFVDVVQIGPSNALSFDFVADNPGKWLYHCHVTDHMMGGMIGMYQISE